MIIIIALIAVVIAVYGWNYIYEEDSADVTIPLSNSVPYNFNDMRPIQPIEIINEIEKSEANNQPILLYFYTTWCGVCKKQFPIINEMARKFQNTDLKVMVIAVDKDITPQKAADSLRDLNEFYFKPEYLSDRAGFKDFLATKSINFKNRIPFTIIVDRNSKIIAQFSGYKSMNYVNRKIMKSLKKDEN